MDMDSEMQQAIQMSLRDATVTECKTFLNDFIENSEESTITLRILRKILRDELKGKCPKLNPENKKMKSHIFDHELIVKFVSAAGFVHNASSNIWQIVQADKFLLQELFLLVQTYLPDKASPNPSPTPSPNLTPGIRPAPPELVSICTPDKSNTLKPSASVAPRPLIHRKKKKKLPKKKPKRNLCAMETSILLNFPDGSSETVRCHGSQILGEIYDYVRPRISFPFFTFIDMGHSPPKSLSEDDMQKKLGELELVPRAKLVIQTTGGVKQGTALDTRIMHARYGDAMNIDGLDYDSLLALDDTQFVGKRLTNREIERSTDRMTYDAENHAKSFIDKDGNDYNSMCVICRQDYEDGETIRKLACGHHYHTNCIDYWLSECKAECPECKNPV